MHHWSMCLCWSTFVSHRPNETCLCESVLLLIGYFSRLLVPLFFYSWLYSCRLTKARTASLFNWWRCLGHCSKRSQSWSILRGKTEMWRRSCYKLLRTQTVERSYSKVWTKKKKKNMEGWENTGKGWEDRQMQWGRGKRRERDRWKDEVITPRSLIKIL